MLEYKCVCGGFLFQAEKGNYVCINCERVWFRCEICSGELHCFDGEEKILEPIYNEEAVETIGITTDKNGSIKIIPKY